MFYLTPLLKVVEHYTALLVAMCLLLISTDSTIYASAYKYLIILGGFVMENKLVKDMTQEEIMEAMNLIKREGENKARLARPVEISDTEDIRTITLEKFGCTATIETSINDDVVVDIYEETDAEFGRRVRFSFKVEQFRKNAPAKRAAYDKQVGNKISRKISAMLENFIDVLGR